VILGVVNDRRFVSEFLVKLLKKFVVLEIILVGGETLFGAGMRIRSILFRPVKKGTVIARG